MTRYLLDTNILSNATKPAPSTALAAWLAEQDDDDLFISTLAVAEIWRGILLLKDGRKRRELENWFSGREGAQKAFIRRVPFDETAALIWARLMAEGVKRGRPRASIDMMIAAIAEAKACIVATNNERDFAGAVQVFNPLRDN